MFNNVSLNNFSIPQYKPDKRQIHSYAGKKLAENKTVQRSIYKDKQYGLSLKHLAFTGSPIIHKSRPGYFRFIEDDLLSLVRDGRITKSDYNRFENGQSEVSDLLNNPDFRSEFCDYLGRLVFNKDKPIKTTIEGDGIIYVYSSPLFSVINNNLRSDNPDKDNVTFKNLLTAALGRLQNHAGIVHRGTGQFEEAQNLKAGAIYNPKEFLSTSTNPEMISKHFSSDYKFVIKSRQGKCINELARHSHEGEVLFNCDSKFKTLAIETTENGKFELGNDLTEEQLSWIKEEREKAKNSGFDGKIATYYMEEI